MVALVRSAAIPPSDLTTVVLANEGHFSALARAISEHLPKLLDVPAGVFPRSVTWSRDGSSLIVGRIEWTGDIFLAERSTRP